MNKIKQLCEADAGRPEVMQGNIAFAVGCARAGIHAADGYPGTPSTEVIDKGLSKVQDKINVGWSVNEAVAAAVGIGHTYAGDDCVVTMKIPGLFQACDIFTSIALYPVPRGSLVFYVASDFTPSSTQHVIDPRYLYRSCFLPVFEPRNHQEMHEAPRIAADVSRQFNTASVVHASGLLCHSEGLVRLAEKASRPRTEVGSMKELNSLPVQTRKAYDKVMAERLPAMMDFVENSPLNIRVRGAGKKGVITCGSGAMHAAEYRSRFEPDLDILSIGFTNPLPMKKIRAFYDEIRANGGEVYVLEDGYRFIQEACLMAGMDVKGKEVNSPVTEWTPAKVAAFLGRPFGESREVRPVPRPPMICAGCPYRLIGETLSKLKKRGEIEAIFGDIGCNTLLYFMNALDTGLAMGASEGIRTGYVLSRPESVAKCVSLLGDGTECHSGMDATRNAVFRNVAGVKIVLDNNWIAMTGGQPSPASPCNLAGQPTHFDLVEALRAQGAEVMVADAYNLKEVRSTLRDALAAAKEGRFVTLVIRGTCIRKVPAADYGQELHVDEQLCKRCGNCLICPGIEMGENGVPRWNNLCTGCVSKNPACGQMCPAKAISTSRRSSGSAAGAVALPEAPEKVEAPKLPASALPSRLSVVIRGVGGQGNLFFGKALAQVAFLAGYGDTNILKGETHGMAQMGGPVISTFACGDVSCPEPVPGTADCLIVMEKSEVLRPGFLDLLRPGGTVLLAETRVFSQAMDRSAYPDAEVEASLAGFRVIRANVLDIALKLGDASGRCANVVMLGALSTLEPFNALPEGIWLGALQQVTPKPELWKLNHAAFKAGQSMIAQA
ncbi:MAG: 2-oxoacid:acceptor oxidoreductase family protein [Desulfovibrionaceae bacterium]|nr:2-oxoacid:acceptor oxidoreductase family protein [Desulfovibrionaceae bacterium]